MPRSGTTLVEQIIASHPDVIGGGELENLGNLIQDKFPLFPLDVLDAENAEYKELGHFYVKSLGSASKINKHTTDKMPRNFLFIGMIALALPKAKIIHCLRSPLDTCVSCYALNFPSGQEFSYNQTELGTYYRLYRDLMEHWKRLLPDKILDISYEKLVVDPEKNVRAILDYCELSWDPKCLSFYQNSRQVLTASATQVRQPVHQKSVRRWQRFKKRLAPLQKALGKYADQV